VNRIRRHSIVLCCLVVVLTPVAVLGSVGTLPVVGLEQVMQGATVVILAGCGWVIWLRVRPRFTRRVLIVGTGSTAAMLIEEIESHGAEYTVVGVVDRAAPADGPVSSRWLGCFEELPSIVERSRPTHIVLATDTRRAQLPYDTLLQSRVRGVLVEDALDFYERLTGTVAIEDLPPGRLAMSQGFRNGGLDGAAARAVSVSAALIGLVVTAPLLLIVAIAIKLDSAGPVLFVQHRAGQGGRPFPLLKFRTMRPCDQRRSEWAKDNEDRITAVGRLLRRFRLDELPQLLNILRGEMNLIGPRPHPVCNTPLFHERIAFYALRSAVLPGLTGWAQVRYGYANTLEEEAEKMRYDLYYIKNRSLWLDSRIAFETIAVMAGLVVRQPTEIRRLPSRRASRAPLRVVSWNAAGSPSTGQP
jgi:exopolysaccharide biosynthesis polyprenyl glycosylphosphotransferase